MTDKSVEERDWCKSVERSCDCEREAATIEPLVRGQQFITPEGVGVDGIVNSSN
jgi:hypothetical protein